MSAAGFFLILGIVIALRLIGNRTIPLIMPTGRKLRIIAIGWVGAYLGSLIDGSSGHIGPVVGGISVAGAAIGCAVTLLAMGIFPFFKILIGRT